ncbi:MAG: hypothetical protein F6K28_59935 [Microcoleus sp. SIO2G3]|nr:hypothetical protein [Microcoleus sp. SIO2G3]
MDAVKEKRINMMPINQSLLSNTRRSLQFSEVLQAISDPSPEEVPNFFTI